MPLWHDANIQVINNKKNSQWNISTGNVVLVRKPLAQGETKPVGNKCNNGKKGKKREKEEGKAVNQHQRDLNWKKCYQKDRFKEFKNILREDLEGTSNEDILKGGYNGNYNVLWKAFKATLKGIWKK